jgi:hypothetical protein
MGLCLSSLHGGVMQCSPSESCKSWWIRASCKAGRTRAFQPCRASFAAACRHALPSSTSATTLPSLQRAMLPAFAHLHACVPLCACRWGHQHTATIMRDLVWMHDCCMHAGGGAQRVHHGARREQEQQPAAVGQDLGNQQAGAPLTPCAHACIHLQPCMHEHASLHRAAATPATQRAPCMRRHSTTAHACSCKFAVPPSPQLPRQHPALRSSTLLSEASPCSQKHRGLLAQAPASPTRRCVAAPAGARALSGVSLCM